MPKLFQSLRSAFNRLRETLFKRFFRARFRYDIFISYSHSDAKTYAVNLKKQLTTLDFSCFIDEEEAPPGSHLDPTLTKALNKSAVLVLLATKHALSRPYILTEFQKFAATNRTIVPINILGALTKNDEEELKKAPWNIITDRKIIWIDENDEAFNKQNPSLEIADGIDKLFKYTRRNVRVRAEIIGTAVLVLLAAIGAGFVIRNQAQDLTAQTQRAKDAGKRATEQEKRALDASIEAQKQLVRAEDARKRAEEQQKIADAAKKEADRQQELARAATAEAERQQQLANAAKEEADRQLTIARARQLANQAELSRGTDSEDLFRSNSMAMRSLDMHPTLEGDFALRKGLSLLPSLSNETPYEANATRVAVSPNATAFGSLTAKTEVEISRTGKPVVRKNRPDVHSYLALSNDGAYFATGGGNKVLIQQTDTQKSWEIEIFEEANIRGIALSPKGKFLAIIANAEEGLWVEVWEREGKKAIGTPMRGSVDFVLLQSVAFSVDKEEVLAVGGYEQRNGGQNGFLRTWLIRQVSGANNECLKEECKQNSTWSFAPQSTLRHPIKVNMIAVAADDDYLVTASQQTALVWKRTRLDDYQQVARIALQNPLALAFDQSLKHLYVISDSDETRKTVKVWEASGRSEIAQINPKSPITAVSFNGERDTFFTVHRTYGDDEDAMRIWDTVSLEQKKRDAIKLRNLDQFDISGDGSYLAAADNESKVRVWDITQKASMEVVTNYRPNILKSIRLSWDGQFLALSGSEKNDEVSVMVYQKRDRSYHEFSRKLILPAGANPETLAISPSGNLLAITIPEQQQIKLWNVKTGTDAPQKIASQLYPVAVLFSPKGELLAALGTSGEAKLWTVATGKELTSLSGSGAGTDVSDAHHNVAFSRDGRYIAVGNFDHTARVFVVATGEELMRLQHDDPVTSVSFSRDGKYLATATSASSGDTANNKEFGLWTWLIQPRDLIAETCKRSQRPC